MAFFSSLVVFYPGRPPALTLGELRKFCEGLRSTLSVKPDGRENLELQFGKSGANEFDAIHEVQWDDAGVVGTLPLDEDRQPEKWHHARNDVAWSALWPGTAYDDKIVVRASSHLGSLPNEACDDLRVVDTPGRTGSGIIPDALGVSINPVYAMTLATEPPDDADICYGFLGLSFYGNGYFTWQPLAEYWQAVGQTATVEKILQHCRETWPVPNGVELQVLRQELGDRFLNRDDYQPGEWIVSVSESG